MAKGGHPRSAGTGRYVTQRYAATHPKTTVTEHGGNSDSVTRHRDAETGQYVTSQYAATHPKTTVTENG